MAFTLLPPERDDDFSALAATLDRTQAPDWLVRLADEAPDLAAILAQDPAALEDAARGWAAIAERLPRGALSASERATLSREDLPAQQGWVRTTAMALQPFAGALGVSADRLGDLVDCDAVLRGLRTFAGRAKDGAVDTRLLLGSFGWYQICLVLDDLRAQLPLLEPAARRRLLGDFAPMLALLAQLQEDRGEGRDAFAAAREAAAADVAEARAEAHAAETRYALRAGRPVSDSDLAALGGREAAAPASAPKRSGRRSRR